MKQLSLGLFLFFALSGCQKDLATVSKTDTKWVLTEWPGQVLPTTAQATFQISEGNRIGGKSFCNVYGGNASFNGNAVQFSKMFSTKMYCEAVQKLEDKYLSDLAEVNSGRVSGGKLILAKDGKVVLVFRPEK